MYYVGCAAKAKQTLPIENVFVSHKHPKDNQIIQYNRGVRGLLAHFHTSTLLFHSLFLCDRKGLPTRQDQARPGQAGPPE